MMRILLAATPAPGHLDPILSAARILIEAGHDVLVTTGSIFQARIEKAGARFVRLSGNADLDMSDVDAAFPERKLLSPGPAQLRFDFERAFIDTIPDQFSGLCTILNDFPADLILADAMFCGTMPLLLGARPTRPAIAGLGVTFLPFHRDDSGPAPLGLPPATSTADITRYQAIAAELNAGLLDPARARTDAILARLGARPLPTTWFDSLVVLPDLFVLPTVAGFEYQRHDLPGSVHFIGALPPPPHPMPPSFETEIATASRAGKRLVLVTQGTAANFDLGQLIAPTLKALAGREDLLVLATTGGRAVTAIPGGVPANARATEFLPYDAVLPRIDVLVTNGGYGTVCQALSRGVPVIVAGMTEDKPEIAARVAWAGAGLNLRTGSPTPEQLREAVNQVLDGSTYRQGAAALATEFRSHDTADELGNLLADLVARRQRSRNAEVQHP